MLNLLRVETGKLLRGRILWLTTLIYIAAVTLTFVALSATGEFSSTLSALPGMEELGIQEELALADQAVHALQNSDNFIVEFYESSSGQATVIMIIAIAFVIADFFSGTLQGTLLSGYSRRQVYLAKLLCGVLGGWIFNVLAMVCTVLVGVLVYGTQLTPAMLGSVLQILAAQCVVYVEYIAVFIAFAFLHGNGWAFLTTSLFFMVVPGISLLVAWLRGLDIAFSTAFLPSFIGINGTGEFFTLDTLLANPSMWTAGLLIPAALVWAALIALSTAAGMWAFSRKKL